MSLPDKEQKTYPCPNCGVKTFEGDMNHSQSWDNKGVHCHVVNKPDEVKPREEKKLCQCGHPLTSHETILGYSKAPNHFGKCVHCICQEYRFCSQLSTPTQETEQWEKPLRKLVGNYRHNLSNGNRHEQAIVDFFEQKITQAEAGATQKTARDIGFNLSSAGINVINLDNPEEYKKAVKGIENQATKQAVENTRADIGEVLLALIRGQKQCEVEGCTLEIEVKN
jgi:hypothetical protein